ncbi:MAG: class I SAM-dependent methyltransferase [Gemmatimonadales bacterium]
MAEWFEQWFGEEYLALYPHRDQADAEKAVALIERTIPWQPGMRVLDIASGPGRHAVALEARGVSPVGVDLSMALLRKAQEVTGSPLVRADMRHLPVRDESCDLALNLFTSFGYFGTDAEHRAALSGMIATLRHGGWFVLDFLQADLVRRTLVPEDHTILGGQAVHIRRRISDDDRYVVKEIDTGNGRVFEERVRLFSPAELESMLSTGLEIVARFGDYDGGPLTPDSPRAFLIGRRP